MYIYLYVTLYIMHKVFAILKLHKKEKFLFNRIVFRDTNRPYVAYIISIYAYEIWTSVTLR